jgi:hypothetical protein
MNTKKITQDDCFANSPLPGVGVAGAQPVAESTNAQAIPKGASRKPRKNRARAKQDSKDYPRRAQISGAKSQENRRKERTDAGKCRVETWVPWQAAQQLKSKAKSLKMTGQEYLAKLITENLAKT